MNNWKGLQTYLNRLVQRREKKVLEQIKKRVDSGVAGLKIDLNGQLAQLSEADKINLKRMTLACKQSELSHINEEIRAHNLANPGWSIEELKPGATYVDITTAMIDLAQSKVYADVDKVAGEHLQGIGEKAYTEAEKVFSVSRGNMFNPDVERVVSELVDRDWLGTGNYHDILQTGSRATVRKVQTMLAQGYARGTSYEHLVEQVAAKMSQADKTGIYRMIYTEGTRVMAEASVKPVTDMGFTEYRLSTVGDNRVCEICREISQKTFRFEDRQPGVNFPPMHTMCRCTFYIVIGDRQAYIDNYVRAHGGDKAAPAELLNRAEG